MNAPERPRVFTPSANSTAPKALFIGLYGPSGCGKTYSALRLATGIQQIFGGEIAVVDTEADRARHYTPPFEFTHYPFAAPYRSVDYLAALRQLVAGGARTIIVDSMSHEHSGPGGVCETHDNLVAEKGQNYTFTAWRIAKAGRKQLITAMTTEFKGCCFIFCFRAKDATDFEVKPPRKLGWMPVSDDDFLFEMTLCALLTPGSDGAPTFKSDMPGERQFLKLPVQFRSIFQQKKPFDEETGRALAEWARGGLPVSPRHGSATVEEAGSDPTTRPAASEPAKIPTAAEYHQQWGTMILGASNVEQLGKTWNGQKELRKKIDWTEQHSYETLRDAVTAAINSMRAPA